MCACFVITSISIVEPHFGESPSVDWVTGNEYLGIKMGQVGEFNLKKRRISQPFRLLNYRVMLVVFIIFTGKKSHGNSKNLKHCGKFFRLQLLCK